MRAEAEPVAGYRCEAMTVAGFVQQLVVGCIARGYWFYVTGCIPPHKDARAVDQKLIERYGIECSKWARHRRKQRGAGNLQYLRFRRFFVLLATPGEHEFFEKEARIQDIRRRPIQCFGYSIGCYRRRDGAWHPSVRIEQDLFREIKRQLLATAPHKTTESLIWELRSLSFEPYGPVRMQIATLLAAVNRIRRVAGNEPLPAWTVQKRRRSVAPFSPK
jgi:hypothetical protein